MRARLGWSIVFICAAGCIAPTKTATRPKGEHPKIDESKGDELLGAGDTIEVKVFREPDLTGLFPVGSSGTLDVPLIGRVNVSGKTADYVADEIRRRLADGYLTDPHVTVLIREHNSHRIHVLGQVQKAGTFSYKIGMSVIEAITNAGGFTGLASPNRVKVTRTVGDEEKTFEVRAEEIESGKAPNFQLEPGDIVYVPESIF